MNKMKINLNKYLKTHFYSKILEFILNFTLENIKVE